jgi:hypothetical protein
MSSNAIVGIAHSGDKVSAIYIHSSGQPERGVGALLMRHYSTDQKVFALVNQGDASFLGKELGEKHSFEEVKKGNIKPEWRDWTLFYHRDRGEKFEDVGPRLYPNIRIFLAESDTPYTYIWMNGMWYVRNGDKELHALTSKLCGIAEAPAKPVKTPAPKPTALKPVKPAAPAAKATVKPAAKKNEVKVKAEPGPKPGAKKATKDAAQPQLPLTPAPAPTPLVAAK